jgi:hypothetical protein
MSAKSNFVLDAVIAAAFLAASNPPLTGQGVHEWLGVSIAAAMAIHVLVHWNWVAGATRRLFARAGRGFRLDYAVDALLFVALTATVLSGLLTSKQLMASLGVTATPRPWWREIHSLGSNALLAGMGVHIGLHWDWLALHVGRLTGVRPNTTPAERRGGPGLDRHPVQGFTAGSVK